MDIITRTPDRVSDTMFYSAEFQLSKSNMMYQFKLRKSLSEPLFAVLKEGSKALEHIREGDVIDMHYHYSDKTLPAELKQTRIKYISKDHSVGFKDHYVVGLCLSEAKPVGCKLAGCQFGDTEDACQGKDRRVA